MSLYIVILISMYDKEEIINTRIEEAREIILKSRKKYDKLMALIEKFIIDNDIIVNKSTERYFFDLFTYDMELSRTLTLLLYKSDPVLAKYVTLVTKIYNKHQRLIINGITFASITYINKEMRENIMSFECECEFINGKYKCFGPEIQLINIYTNLYMPLEINRWLELIKIEKNLYNKEFQRRITGGSRDVNSDSEDDSSSDDSDTNIIINKSLPFVEQLLLYYVSKKHVIVGKVAIDFYNDTTNAKNTRLQIISEKPFNTEIKKLRKIFSSINYSISHLHLPTNLNMYKLIIYHDKKPVLDIFNAASFQVIPYNIFYHKNKRLQIGSPYVIKCFKLIDVWNILYLSNTGVIDKDKSSNIINMTMNFKLDTNIEKLFPLNFIGQYEDLMLRRERLANKLKIKYIVPYMPYLHADSM